MNELLMYGFGVILLASGLGTIIYLAINNCKDILYYCICITWIASGVCVLYSLTDNL
jgi:hypothetical protein